MSSELYRRLRDCLDEYSVGFRETGTDVELKILKKFFTEEEARMYLNLTLDLQSSREVAEKTNQDHDKVEEMLQQMMVKGLVIPRFPKKEGEPFYYAAAPFMHGILEHQLNRLDKEAAELFEEYIQQGWISKGPIPLRNIPVKTSIDNFKSVTPYDDIREIVKSKDRICLTDCLCSYWQRTRGVPCDQPTEICMFFDFYAEYYVDKGMGRWITQEEALTKLDECEKYGLIPQLSNSKNPEVICNCCVNCCGQLRILKMLPQPGWFVASNYFSRIDPDLCSACESCIDRCPMEAIGMDDEIAVVNRDRCIGCGLCVSICPEEAIGLQEKPEAERIEPPDRSDFMKPSIEFEKKFK